VAGVPDEMRYAHRCGRRPHPIAFLQSPFVYALPGLERRFGMP
jgi:hypothetical protein